MKWACDELETGDGINLTSLIFAGRAPWDYGMQWDDFTRNMLSFKTEATAKEVFGSDEFFFCILDEGIEQLSNCFSLAPANLAKIHPFAFLKLELPKILANFEVARRPEHALAFAMVWRSVLGLVLVRLHSIRSCELDEI